MSVCADSRYPRRIFHRRHSKRRGETSTAITAQQPIKVACISWNGTALGCVTLAVFGFIARARRLQESKLPLVVLLDGQYWAEAMPVFSALDHATQADLLPPSVYVLIDSLDAKIRTRELACDEAFLEAVQQELLTIVAGLAPCCHDPSKTVIAGQSFGGLAALFAGLRSPECFGCVLSQSGSFWWPGSYVGEELRAARS